MSLLDLYCHVDDFYQTFAPAWERVQLEDGLRHRQREARLSPSEMMTILIHFHQVQFRTFKAYYTRYVQVHLREAFPAMVSYHRFVELLPRLVVPLCGYLQACLGTCTGLSFVDSTALAVCHNRRIGTHQVFRDLAARGKTSMGWFYGFKLHVVITDAGALLSWRLTPGNIDDRTPVPALTRTLTGKLFGDKGYISAALAERLHTAGLSFMTTLKATMKPRPLPPDDAHLLRQRRVVESVIDQFKNVSQIQHTRHRSLTGFLTNLFAGLLAYCHQPAKPSIQTSLPALVIPN